MLDFFSKNEFINLRLEGAEVLYYPQFLTTQESVKLYHNVYQNTPWQQDDICVYGKTYPQPRLTHLFAENDLSYSYSNITMHPSLFTEEIVHIKNRIEQTTNHHFTTCLANLYRNGSDSNGWHADNEKELGEDPIIASLSIGNERWFYLKHKTDKTLKKRILLQPGSLLLMGKGTQLNYLHQIPKTKKLVQPRINLTFRKIIEPNL